MATNREIKISEEEVRLFQKFILEYSGIKLNEFKFKHLKSNLSSLLCKKGFESYQQYHQFLKSRSEEESELRELLALVTINETSFFRYLPHFTALREQILPEMVRRNQTKDRTLKIWSAGCSTGEEPYSVGMTLLEVLSTLSTWNIKLLATDIDQQALARAKAGIYNGYSLRNLDSEYRSRYFDHTDGRFHLHKKVKEMVEFQTFNMMDEPYPLPKAGNWDIIFCRNVTIYFKKKQTKRVIHNFYDSLREGGYLFLGHAETLFGIFDEFSMIRIGDTFVYQKPKSSSSRQLKRSSIGQTGGDEHLASLHLPARDDTSLASRDLPRPDIVETTPPVHRDTSPRTRCTLADTTKETDRFHLSSFPQPRLSNSGATLTLIPKQNLPTPEQDVRENDSLSNDIQNYLMAGSAAADNGNYEEAAVAYQQAIEFQPLSVEAHFFMGVISEHLNDLDRAVDEYRKAIYLDDMCTLAHFNLARIYQLIGQEENARRGYNNTVRKLKLLPSEEEVKFSGGFSAGLLAQTCHRKIEELGNNS